MDERDSGVPTYAGTESGPRTIVINCAIKDTVGSFAERVVTDRRTKCSFGDHFHCFVEDHPWIGFLRPTRWISRATDL
jgi:hypothetical protein